MAENDRQRRTENRVDKTDVEKKGGYPSKVTVDKSNMPKIPRKTKPGEGAGGGGSSGSGK